MKKNVFQLEVGDLSEHLFLALEIIDTKELRLVYWMMPRGYVVHSFYDRGSGWERVNFLIY